MTKEDKRSLSFIAATFILFILWLTAWYSIGYLLSVARYGPI